MNLKQIYFLTVFALSITLISCTQKQKEVSEEEQVTKMLKNFYTVYIMTFEDYLKINPGHPDQLTAKIDSIERAYLTSKFYNYLKTVNKDGLVLDFDPFIGGQMIDKLMLEEMTFKKIDNDLYEVHYKYGDYYNKVKLRIRKESGLFKIGDAFFEVDGREYELTKDEPLTK